MPWEFKISDEANACLADIKPILKKYNYAGRRSVQLYFISPTLHKICKWSADATKKMFGEQDVNT